MNDLERALDALREETRPSPARVDRVQRALARRVREPRSTGFLLRFLPEPAPGAVARVRARLRGARRRPLAYPVLAGLVTAAAITVAIVVSTPNAPTTAALVSADAWNTQPLSDAVTLAYQGQGQVYEHGDEVDISWSSGRIELEVEPDRGVDLEINTGEARIRVVGTAFSVERSPLGTAVDVERGVVGVLCHSGREYRLGAGEHGECLPTSAVGLLARAQTLVERESWKEALVAADAGLIANPGDHVLRGELSVARINALLALGRDSEALDEAERYLSLPEPIRESHILPIAVTLALQAGDCQRALPLLRALDPSERTPQHEQWLQVCQQRVEGSAR